MEIRRGSCHCGDVRFEVTGALEGVLECNCTVCTKKGFLHWIVTPDRFRLLAGEPATYSFGTHVARHTFCPRCGMHPFYTPRSHPGHVDVNVRCLDDFDLRTVPVHAFDGRNDWEGSLARLAPSSASIEKANLREKLALFHDHWNPRVIAELNGQSVKLAKLLGPFVWHSHAVEDELFYVLRGRLRMELRDRSMELEEGELVVIPRGVEHRPVADDEVSVLLFEPIATLNTGDATEEARTRKRLERI